MTEANPPAPAQGAAPAVGNVLASTTKVTAGNLASRVTGLVRVLAVGAALGATFLGNTYQSSNLVSNLLFELLAAGVLSSVLVPPFVEMLDAGHRGEAEDAAGSFLGLGLVVLGLVCVIAIAARTWIMRGLTVAVDDTAVRAAEVRLGSFLLVLFVPQVLLYAVGTVATALLHGARRFTAVAFAPVANNVVVIATMGLFWAAQRGGEGAVQGAAGLDVGTTQKLILAVGTTAGVAAMSLVPLVAAWRCGLRLRPRWNPSHPRVRSLARTAGWGAVYLALSQLLIATTLVLANQVAGGVVAYQIAFTVFLLPHALLAQPLITVLYPQMSAEASGGRWHDFSRTLAKGGRWIVFLTMPAAALVVAAAGPAMRLLQIGHLDASGTGLVARVAAAYAFGIAGYAGYLLVTRASYAAGDTRTPALVNLGVTVGGSALMVALFAAASGDDKVVVLGLAYAAAVSTGCVVLFEAVRRRAGHPSPIGLALARAAGCGAVAGAAARGVVSILPSSGRLDDGVAVAGAVFVVSALYFGGQLLLRSRELADGGNALVRALAGWSTRRPQLTIPHAGATADGGSTAATPVVALVPAKDQAATIAATVAALQRVPGVDEVVVIDDGSRDATASLALAAGARVLSLSRNAGKGGAVAAGVGATPEAGIYLLIDGDVGASAESAAPLLAPVLSGAADLAIGVLPPAGRSGGFGAVRNLARAGIEASTGRRFQAPLSGQRAIRAPLLRRMDLAPRFGLEVGMTVDALRVQARVVEVDVGIAHRPLGRTVRGFVHRGGQCVDVVRALWSRLTSSRARIAATVIAFAVLLTAVVWAGGQWEPRSRPPSARAQHVLIVGIPGLTFADIQDGRAPAIAGLTRTGAVGAISVRTLSADPSPAEAYATLGAGSRVEVPVRQLRLDVGTNATASVVGSDHLLSVNRGDHVPTLPGTLGRALHAAGRRTAALGSPDAAAAVMDITGAVDEVYPVPRPAAVAAAAAQAMRASDVAVVGAEDVASGDALTQRLAETAPPGTLLLAAGITPPGDEWRLTPLVASGAGVVHGLLQSQSTKRLGVATLTDLAPTVLESLGVRPPSAVVGHPLRYHAGKADVARLADLDRDAAYRERIYFGAAAAFIALQAVVYVLTVYVLRRRGGPAVAGRSPWRAAATAGALGVAAFPLATFLLRAVPGLAGARIWAGALVLCALDGAIVFAATRAHRHPLSPLAWIFGCTVAVLVADIATGGRLQMASIMGYSPQSAGRFFGIGNTAFAALAASAILAVVLHVRHAPRRAEAVVTASLVLALVAVVDGHPSLGSDVGGILTLVPVFGLTILALVRRRLTWRMVAGVAFATILVLALAAGLDLLRAAEARTHLGRAVAETFDGGPASLATTITRKVDTNFRLLRASVWTWAVPVTAVFMLLLLADRRRAATLLPPGSPLRTGVISALTAGLLGFAANDSGVVVTAVVLSCVGAFLAVVALAERRRLELVTDPAPGHRDLPVSAGVAHWVGSA